ncbi:hypothetical protein SKAU_G00422290 [Synaphobranchus kaupii]|uniref:DUF4764 domain-containing protein n=1 Tax=Synaphobranchus kaupii TaxID=118154 RepID=A0A9Q1E6U7_SYNKA|nr:hypothetical protein SKAU_G00422290 [Synaphobranchus kaupii]
MTPLTHTQVDKGHPSMPQFSDVYREFEQLHTQVKKMAQDHFSGPHGTGPHAVLDVRDPQVCQSLGIGHLVTRLKTLPSEIPAVLLEGDLPAKNTGPREDCKTLPPAKRFKMDQSNVEPNGTFLSQNRTVLTAAGVGPSPGSVEIRHQDRCLATKSLLPEKNPTEVVGYQPMELSSHPQTALGLPSPQTETEEQQANITDPAGPSPSHTLGAEPGEGVELNGSDVADQMQQLEQVLSSDVVPLDHTYRAHTPLQTQPCTQPPGQTEHAQTITQPHGQTEHAQTITQPHGQTEHAQTITQPSGQTEHAQKLASPGPEEQAESLGGTVEQVSGDPVEFQEQIFIQTEEGLILPGGVLTSERIVIVTSPDGTTMHIRTPDTVPLETVPLETVQALLGIDMGTQPEAVLVSENHP